MKDICPLSDIFKHRVRRSVYHITKEKLDIFKLKNNKSIKALAIESAILDGFSNISDLAEKHIFPLSLIMYYHRRVIFGITCETFFKAVENIICMKDFITKDKYQNYYTFDYGEAGRYIDFD